MVEALTNKVKTIIAISPTAGAAGQTAINGATLDLEAHGCDAFRVVVLMGAITGGAVTSMKIQTDDNSSMSSGDDLTGSAITIADDKDETLFISDVINPPQRYARVVVSRGTQNAAVAGAVYELYRIRELPVAKHANVTTQEIHRDKVTGTA